MLDLQARGFGTAKGIPTMVVAAASFDDVLAIAGFGVCLALVSGDGGGGGADLAWLVLKAPAELCSGILSGLLLGSLVAAPGTHGLGPAAHAGGALLCALLVVFGGKALLFSGGGALAAVVLGTTAAHRWPHRQVVAVQARVNWVWAQAQPALFGLLGAAVDVRALAPALLGRGLLLLAGGLVVRIGVTRLALLRSGLTAREALFVCVAWLPKATVQAAVGGAALDLVLDNGLGDEARHHAETVLTLSVLVILLTAPLGAVGIALAGPAWLSSDSDAHESTTAAASPLSPARQAALEARQAALEARLAGTRRATGVTFATDLEGEASTAEALERDLDDDLGCSPAAMIASASNGDLEALTAEVLGRSPELAGGQELSRFGTPELPVDAAYERVEQIVTPVARAYQI